MLEYNIFGDLDSTQEKRVIMFPGQGAQFVGMGSDVCDSSPTTQAVWDCACDISGFDVRKLCLKGPMTRLTKTIYQQVAATTVNVAMFENALENGLITKENTAFIGHSSGEYSALYAAGVFDLENLFKAVFARASIMQELAECTDGMMFVVKDIPYHQLNEFIISSDVTSNIKIANDDSPKQQVISGDSEIIKHFSIYLQQAGFPQIKLPVNGAWHSHLMLPAEDSFKEALESVVFKQAEYPIFMNVSAENTVYPEQIKANLISHMINTVRWRETLESLYQEGYQHFMEIGSKKVLTQLLVNHSPLNELVTISHITDNTQNARHVA